MFEPPASRGSAIQTDFCRPSAWRYRRLLSGLDGESGANGSVVRSNPRVQVAVTRISRWRSSQSDLHALRAFGYRRSELAADSVVFLISVIASIRLLVFEVADHKNIGVAGAKRRISMHD